MTKAGEFLNDIFVQLGFEPTDPTLAEIVKQTINIDLPDDYKTKFHDTYMTSEVAKTKLKPELIAAHSDHIEKQAIEKAKALGFTDEEIKATEVGERSAYKRIQSIMDMMDKKAKELVKKGSSGLADEYKNQLEQLQAKLDNEKSEAVKPFQEKLSKMESRLFAEWEKAEYGSLPLSKSLQALPESAKRAIIKDAIENELSSLQGELIYDFETGQPMLVKKGQKDVPLFHENKPLDFKTLKGLAITRQKLDIDSGGGQPNDPAQPQIITVDNPSGGGKQNGIRQLANSAYDVALNSLSTE